MAEIQVNHVYLLLRSELRTSKCDVSIG